MKVHVHVHFFTCIFPSPAHTISIVFDGNTCTFAIPAYIDLDSIRHETRALWESRELLITLFTERSSFPLLNTY